jgi:hypothetical protein
MYTSNEKEILIMFIVVNKEYGGFSLSEAAQEMLGINTAYPDIDRDDPHLVEVVQALGEKAGGLFASLEVACISDFATDWTINENDGYEDIIYVVDGHLCYA